MRMQLNNADKLTIHHALDIYEIMQLVFKREQKLHQGKEHFWVIALNNANRILNLELISLGSTTQVIVKPMEVLSIPLQKRAIGVILVHNHPSGSLQPSEADKDLTDMLIQACKLMKTPVLDHVIITEHSYYSFQESGLLERLEASNKYVLPYELAEQHYQEMKEAVQESIQEGIAIGEQKGREVGKEEGIQLGMVKGEEKGLKKGRAEGIQEGLEKTAKQMLAKGLDTQFISELTGLSEEQLQQLTP